MSRRKIENSGERRTSAEAFSQALEALGRGEVIVFPTETFYGLGADAFDAAAVEIVLTLKGRSPEIPIPVVVADQKMLASVVADIPVLAQKLIDHFWPGPLTLVLPAKKGLPAPLLNREGKIGVRISSHPLATRLTHELERPLTATSANLSGKEPARTIQEAQIYFSDKIEIFLDGGRLTGTSGSTVAEICNNELKIIREGEISREELEKVIGG